MRVLYVVQSPFIGGAERSLCRILVAIQSVGVEPIVVTAFRGPVEEALRDTGARVAWVSLPYPSYRNFFSFLVALWKLYRMIRREHVDVVHANDVTALPIAGRAARWAGVHRFCHVRYGYEPEFLSWLLKPGLERVIVVSEYMRRELTKRCPGVFPQERCSVVPNGFSTPRHPSPVTERWRRTANAWD